MAFPAQSPDLRRRSLGRGGFAVSSPLALNGGALYPISVRRLAVSLSASFSAGLATLRLAFRLESPRPGPPEDLHLLVMLMLGTLRRTSPRGIRPPRDEVSQQLNDCRFSMSTSLEEEPLWPPTGLSLASAQVVYNTSRNPRIQSDCGRPQSLEFMGSLGCSSSVGWVAGGGVRATGLPIRSTPLSAGPWPDHNGQGTLCVMMALSAPC